MDRPNDAITSSCGSGRVNVAHVYGTNDGPVTLPASVTWVDAAGNPVPLDAKTAPAFVADLPPVPAANRLAPRPGLTRLPPRDVLGETYLRGWLAAHPLQFAALLADRSGATLVCLIHPAQVDPASASAAAADLREKLHGVNPRWTVEVLSLPANPADCALVDLLSGLCDLATISVLHNPIGPSLLAAKPAA